LIHFADAKLVQGFDLVADLLQLDARIGASDRVVTGEGSLDVQSLGGKGPVALARRARAIGTPVTAFCGSADRSLREAAIFDQILALDESGLPLETLMREAAGLVTELAASAAREWKA
jgi:glycerate kinase